MTDIQVDEIDRQFEAVTVTDPASFDRLVVTGRTFEGDNITTYADAVSLNGQSLETGGMSIDEFGETVTVTKEAGSPTAKIRV